MSERIQALKARLDHSRQYLEKVINAVGDRWDASVYSDGLAWNVRQVLVHLADAERGHYNQATNIAEGKDIIPPDFDIQRYNKRTTEKGAEKTAQQALEELTTQRTQLLAWLDTLDEARLDQQGRHASLQIMSVEDIVIQASEHERLHAQDIAKALDLNV